MQEKKGLKKFMRIGCTTCHSGVNLGGSSFQKLGLVKPYPTKDLGRYNITKKSRDKRKFKVPTLRNIEKTAPYLHDGSIKGLRETISIMGVYQLGKKLQKHHLDDIEAFLKSLTSKQKSYL
jgi:cytochrome c peroxidase